MNSTPPGFDVATAIDNTLWKINNTPELQQCDTQSLITAIANAITLGLDPSGLTGDGTLSARHNQRRNTYRALFIPDYRGLIRIAATNPRISHIESHIVRQDDLFQLDFGDPEGQIITHHPNLTAPTSPPLGAYAIAWWRDRTRPLVEWMTTAEINANADRGTGTASDFSPWKTDWPQMARKTVIKRLVKYLPLSCAAAAAMHRIDADIHAPDETTQPTREPQSHLSPLAEEFTQSIATAELDGLDAVIDAIREDARLNHQEKTHLFNLACKTKRDKRTRRQ